MFGAVRGPLAGSTPSTADHRSIPDRRCTRTGYEIQPFYQADEAMRELSDDQCGATSGLSFRSALRSAEGDTVTGKLALEFVHMFVHLISRIARCVARPILKSTNTRMTSHKTRIHYPYQTWSANTLYIAYFWATGAWHLFKEMRR